jgi:hypothetical protein
MRRAQKASVSWGLRAETWTRDIPNMKQQCWHKQAYYVSSQPLILACTVTCCFSTICFVYLVIFTAEYTSPLFVNLLHILTRITTIKSDNTTKMTNYKTDWRDHANRMARSRLPKLITQSIPKGRRDRGRPIKKLTDGFWGRNRPTLAYMMMINTMKI